MSEIGDLLDLVAAARAAGTEGWTTIGATVQRVAGGFNNAIYRVEVDDQVIACKLLVADERRRASREYAALRALEDAGLDVAPIPLGIDETCQRLPYPAVLYRWLPGNPLPAKLTQKHLVALLESIRQVQALPRSYPLEHAWFHWFAFGPYLEEMETFLPRYGPCLQALDPEGASLVQRIENLLRRCAKIVVASPTDPSSEIVPLRLCRVDCNLANAVLGPDGRLRWVDWEYSGWGDPALELADYRWHAGSAGLSEEQHLTIREKVPRPEDDPGFEERLAVWDALIVTRWCLLTLRTLWTAHNGLDRLRLSQPDLDPDRLRLRLLQHVERAERTLAL